MFNRSESLSDRCARRARVAPVVALAAAVAVAACRDHAPTAAAPPPAKVANPVKEADLTTVTLTAKAEARLGIALAPAERRRVDPARVFMGEVLVPRGRAVLTSAPVAGTVLGASAWPAAGARLKRGQVVLRLVPLPPSSELAAAGVRLDAARKRAARAASLLEAGAGSERTVEEARGEVDLAEASLAAGRPGRHPGAGAAAVAVTIAAPQDGVLHDLLVAPGQSVAAGAPLFQVDAVDALWIRVPVYVGEIGAVDRQAPARVRALSSPAGDPGREAEPVAAPPSADPLAATGDLYFRLDNLEGSLRPGEKVEVSVALAGAGEERLVVPWSAVVFDVYGGAWVYETHAPHVFSRRRVEVERVAGVWAVLKRGPAVGTSVVSVGAAELFGTEFGAGK